MECLRTGFARERSRLKRAWEGAGARREGSARSPAETALAALDVRLRRARGTLCAAARAARDYASTMDFSNFGPQ